MPQRSEIPGNKILWAERSQRTGKQQEKSHVVLTVATLPQSLKVPKSMSWFLLVLLGFIPPSLAQRDENCKLARFASN